jgi:hypothetical protein
MRTGPTILLVNDDEDGLFLLERTLTRELPKGSIYKARGRGGFGTAGRKADGCNYHG